MTENFNQNNTEIDQALKEFEVKAQTEQAQENPEVAKTSDVPKITGLVMKWFGLEEQKYAEYILLGFSILAILVSLFLFFKPSFNSSTNETPNLRGEI